MKGRKRTVKGRQPKVHEVHFEVDTKPLQDAIEKLKLVFPSPALLAKLAAIIEQSKELCRDLDSRATLELDIEMRDSDVVAWLKGMKALALIPVKRR